MCHASIQASISSVYLHHRRTSPSNPSRAPVVSSAHMVSSVISVTKLSLEGQQHDSQQRIQDETSSSSSELSQDLSNEEITVCLTIYIFRGEPDAYHRRHIMAYFTSPDDPTLHETVHTQRNLATGEWVVNRMHESTEWALQVRYLNHVNAGAMVVRRGDRMAPADVVADTPVEGRAADRGWNCQNFLLEGLQGIVKEGLQTKEWYDAVEGEVLDKLLEGGLCWE